jgi:hypothetical protein
MIEVELPDGRVIEVDTDDPQVAARAAAKFLAGPGRSLPGRSAFEALGGVVGGVAGGIGGAAHESMESLGSAARAIGSGDIMGAARSVPGMAVNRFQGAVAGYRAGEQLVGSLF